MIAHDKASITLNVTRPLNRRESVGGMVPAHGGGVERGRCRMFAVWDGGASSDVITTRLTVVVRESETPAEPCHAKGDLTKRGANQAEYT